MYTSNERRMYTHTEHTEICFHSDSDSAVKAVMYYSHWLIHTYMMFFTVHQEVEDQSSYIQCSTTGVILASFF